jgi:hypothetical protein
LPADDRSWRNLSVYGATGSLAGPHAALAARSRCATSRAKTCSSSLRPNARFGIGADFALEGEGVIREDVA